MQYLRIILYISLKYPFPVLFISTNLRPNLSRIKWNLLESELLYSLQFAYIFQTTLVPKDLNVYSYSFFLSLVVRRESIKYTLTYDARSIGIDFTKLFTGVFFNMLRTYITLDLAAPLKFTVTPFLDDNLFRIVSSSAAENCASIQPGRCFVTNATMSACN